MRARVFWLALVVVCGVSRWAAARERLAVFVAAEREAALAENLTEVAIAKLAELARFELVGLHELDASLSQMPSFRGQGLQACVGMPRCLAELGARAGVMRAVIGLVRRQADGFELDFSLTDTQTSVKKARATRSVPGAVTELIGAVQGEVGGLFEPELTTPPAPEPAAAPTPRKTEAPRRPSTRPRPPPIAPLALRVPAPRAGPDDDTQLRTYLGLGAAGAAVLTFSAAVITGTLATAPPSGDTRAERQKDVERRRDYATIANACYVAGGVLAAGAAVAFVWP